MNIVSSAANFTPFPAKSWLRHWRATPLLSHAAQRVYYNLLSCKHNDGWSSWQATITTTTCSRQETNEIICACIAALSLKNICIAKTPVCLHVLVHVWPWLPRLGVWSRPLCACYLCGTHAWHNRCHGGNGTQLVWLGSGLNRPCPCHQRSRSSHTHVSCAHTRETDWSHPNSFPIKYWIRLWQIKKAGVALWDGYQCLTRKLRLCIQPATSSQTNEGVYFQRDDYWVQHGGWQYIKIRTSSPFWKGISTCIF